ncbi:outer membrane protein assembly factor BamB family protein [Haladaptatus salinisoli]|uniref:outer membrane protein assembly factor BamB family protein n=1 Tax=Haladaptatus salinisoli TaxID=2884876 RepID=UPI001D0B1493|nr:PQQ-binding-like beta-propeller repeat protein [Haladaptatus salinisoli]
MDSSPSSLSRRGFLSASGTLGAAAAVGRAQTTTTEPPAGDAPEPEWTVSGSNVEAYYPLATGDGTVYAVSVSDSNANDPRRLTVHAFGLADGNEKWTVSFPSLYNLFVEGGTVYAVATVGEGRTGRESAFVALDPKSGDERWRCPLGDHSYGVEFGGGNAYVSNQSEVTAIDLNAGEKAWEESFGMERHVYRLVHVGDTVYVGSSNDIEARSAKDGRKRWGAAERGLDGVRLTLADRERAYCESEGASLALDPADGSRLWSVATDGTVPRPVLHDGTLYRWGKKLSAIDVTEGSVRWRYDAKMVNGYEPIVGDGAVFSATRGAISAVDFDGTERWTFELPTGDDFYRFWGDVHDGIGYFLHGARLYALSADDGTLRWSFQADPSVTMATAAGDRIVVGTEGALYGFDRRRPFLAAVVDDTTDFLGSGVGLAFSGILVGTGAFAAYRRLNEDEDPPAVDPEPKLEYGRLERLAADEFTETYLVRKHTDDGPSVVREKRLTDPDLAETFRAAVERWADLSDRTGVVPVLDHGDEWIELPEYEGGSLADDGRPLAERIDALSEANAAVHRAHADGLVHGGLDPGTILVDGDGTADVSDWELAAALGERGDPSPYAPPEQVAGGEPDERTDVYRLGATAYFLVTGAAPADVSPGEIERAVRRADPTLPRAVDEVLSTALADDPTDRYESVVKFDDMLRWAAFRA